MASSGERKDGAQKQTKKKHLAPQKTTKKPKKQFGNRIGEMWIIFLYFIFSRPRHHHPAKERQLMRDFFNLEAVLTT